MDSADEGGIGGCFRPVFVVDLCAATLPHHLRSLAVTLWSGSLILLNRFGGEDLGRVDTGSLRLSELLNNVHAFNDRLDPFWSTLKILVWYILALGSEGC